MPKQKLYRLSDGDRQIIERARKENNPNWITNYYFRSSGSGTWWRPVGKEQINSLTIPNFIDTAQRWKEGYDSLRKQWAKLGKPDYFVPEGNRWKPISEGEFEIRREKLQRVYRTVIEDDEGYPAFHHPHGIILLPWQLDLWRSKQPIIVIIGGYGSGKTWAKIIHKLCRGLMLPNYRAFGLAPYAKQATEVWVQTKRMIEGTKFERFLIGMPKRPNPRILFGHEDVKIAEIECIPIADDPDKVLTMSGDECLIDQAEAFDDLDTVIRNTSTRFRGIDPHSGRKMVAQTTLVANSSDNPILWDWFDDGVKENRRVKSFQVSTAHNTKLTIDDLVNFEAQVGRDDYERRVHLEGERPIGTGELFSREMLDQKVRSRWFEEILNQNANKVSGWVVKKGDRVDTYYIETPPEQGHRYIVTADPGWANPPERNSPVVGVWNVTSFPIVPARLVAFSWVFGQGDPGPWLAEFSRFITLYNAQGYYDGTGFQAGYEKFPTGLSLLNTTPIKLNGESKWSYLNLTRVLMSNGMYQIPFIPHLFSQFSRYKIPDNNLRQDIVSMVCIASAALEPAYMLWLANQRRSNRPEDAPDIRADRTARLPLRTVRKPVRRLAR